MAASDYDILDPRFADCIDQDQDVEKLWTGSTWTEGPAYFPLHRSLIFSDIPNDRMMRFDELSGQTGVYRQPSGESNGNTRDREGRLVTCEGMTRRVTRTEHDGTITVVAERFQGKRLNSPNDLVITSDGTIWFTDPTYGIDGHKIASEIGSNNVYRVDPATGEVSLAVTGFVQPNGLAFSLDERKLYVVDTGATHVENGPRHIRVFDVKPDGSLTGGDVFCTCTNHLFDGFRFDADGRIWTSAGDGVHCYATDGTLIGKICLTEVTANVEFGGPDLDTLYICAATSLYRVKLKVRGHRSLAR